MRPGTTPQPPDGSLFAAVRDGLSYAALDNPWEDKEAYRAVLLKARQALDEIAATTDLAWAAVAANYDTSGGDIIQKQPLWTALSDLEMALRKVGYVA